MKELTVSSFWLLHAGPMIPGANIGMVATNTYMGNLRQLNAKHQPGGATLPTTAADKNFNPTGICCMGKIPSDPPGLGIYVVH